MIFGSEKMKWTSSNGEDEDKSKILSYGGGFGVAFPLGKHLAFDLIANYNSYSSKAEEDNEDNYRTVTGTFGIKFGFIIFLAKKENSQ